MLSTIPARCAMRPVSLTLSMAAALLVLAAALPAAAQAPDTPASPGACASSFLDIEGNRIWVDREGAGKVTVVFEAGFGNDSSVWSPLTPRIRAAGAQTFVYDRAGMGKSSINTATPYSIDNDVHILRTALTDCGIEGPILLVGHSYGGAIGLMTASQDPRVMGLVLLDAVVPHSWPRSEVAKNLKLMRSQYDEVRKQAPELARVAIPWAEAMPQTARTLDTVRVRETLPIIDIVAENGRNDPASTRIWRSAHLAFTADNPHRSYVFAVGSSHKVMADQPDLVVDSILGLLGQIQQP